MTLIQHNFFNFLGKYKVDVRFHIVLLFLNFRTTFPETSVTMIITVNMYAKIVRHPKSHKYHR